MIYRVKSQLLSSVETSPREGPNLGSVQLEVADGNGWDEIRRSLLLWRGQNKGHIR